MLAIVLANDGKFGAITQAYLLMYSVACKTMGIDEKGNAEEYVSGCGFALPPHLWFAGVRLTRYETLVYASQR